MPKEHFEQHCGWNRFRTQICFYEPLNTPSSIERYFSALIMLSELSRTNTGFAVIAGE
jgi:hypothetical protein